MSATRRDLMAGAAAASLAFAGSALAAEPSDADQLARLLALERRLVAAYEDALARDAIEPALGKLQRRR